MSQFQSIIALISLVLISRSYSSVPEYTTLSSDSFIVAISWQDDTKFAITTNQFITYSSVGQPWSGWSPLPEAITIRTTYSNLLSLKTGNIVLAEGLNIHILTPSGSLLSSITSWTQIASENQKRISLTLLVDGGFLITRIFEQSAYVRKYAQDLREINEQLITNIHDFHISCTAFQAPPYHIACFHVNNENSTQDFISLFTSGWDLIESKNIADIDSAIEQKINANKIYEWSCWFDDDKIWIGYVIAFEAKYWIYPVIVQQNPGATTSTQWVYKYAHKGFTQDFAACFHCSSNAVYTNLITIQKGVSFACICQSFANHSSYVWSLIKIVGAEMNFVKANEAVSQSEMKWVSLLPFQSEHLGLFHIADHSAIFRWWYTPNCKDYHVNIDSQGHNFIFQNTIYKAAVNLSSNIGTTFGSDNADGVAINPIDATDPSKIVRSVLIYPMESTETPVDNATSFPSSTWFTFNAGSEVGIIEYTFYPVNIALNNRFTYCKLIFDISPCFESCFSCSSFGTEHANDCLTCDTNALYFPVVDQPTQCQKFNIDLDGYYFNQENKQFERCFIGCETCHGQGTVENSNCKEGKCVSNYFPWSNIKTQCYRFGSNIVGYYFNSDRFEFEPCYQGCSDCSGFGTSVHDTQCWEGHCDTNADYFPVAGNTKQCYHKEMVVERWYFDATQFKNCHPACLSCHSGATVDDTKCLICDKINNFYPWPGYSSRCHRSDYWPYPEGFYFDSTRMAFQHCGIQCRSCVDGRDCIACATGYHFLIATDECYNTSNNPRNTALVGDFFIPCYESCAKCSMIGSESNSWCDECDYSSAYYPVENDPSNCINDAAREKFFGFYYLNYASQQYERCSIECASCQGTSTTCRTCNTLLGYYFIENTSACVTNFTKPEDFVLYTDPSDANVKVFRKCYHTCSRCNAVGDSTVNNCVECIGNRIFDPVNASNCVEKCPYYYYIDILSGEYKCADECAGAYKFAIPSSKECVSSCGYPMFIYNNMCLESCPSDTVNSDPNNNYCNDWDVCRKSVYEITTRLPELTDDIVDEMAYTYSQSYLYTTNHVSVVSSKTLEYEITIFKNEECEHFIARDLVMIDWKDCPNQWRRRYSLPEDTYLIILKLNIPRQGKCNTISYAFYHPETGERWDTTICQNEVVNIITSISNTNGVDIEEAKYFAGIGIDVYDAEDPFFSDICYEYTSVEGKDVTWSDRRSAYFQNVSLCESDCTYNGVNLETEEVNCTCAMKTSIINTFLDNPWTGELLELLDSANFQIIKCYEDVFTFRNILENIGGWIIASLFWMQVPFYILYFNAGWSQWRGYWLKYMAGNPPKKEVTPNIWAGLSRYGIDWDEGERSRDTKDEANNKDRDSVGYPCSNNNIQGEVLNNITDGTRGKAGDTHEKATFKNGGFELKDINSSFKKSEMKTEEASPAVLVPVKQLNQKSILMVLKENNLNDQQWLDVKDNKSQCSVSSSGTNDKWSSWHKKQKNNKKKASKIQLEKSEINSSKSMGGLISQDKKQSQSKAHQDWKKRDKNGNKQNEMNREEYTDEDLNEMELYDAIEFDTRTFWVFYWQQLREKHDVILTFCNMNIMEPLPIKAVTFFFGHALYFTLNALFFSESYISDQFNSGEDIDFIYWFTNEISRYLYSSAIGLVVNSWIACIASSRTQIESMIKREKDPKRFRGWSARIIKKMKIKIFFFLVLNLIFMFLFWYYVSAFCNVYRNSQMSWLIGCCWTFGIIMLIPFVLCLLIGGSRFIGMKYENEMFFKISLCLMN